jgi:hypothetical protein
MNQTHMDENDLKRALVADAVQQLDSPTKTHATAEEVATQVRSSEMRLSAKEVAAYAADDDVPLEATSWGSNTTQYRLTESHAGDTP